MADDSGGLSIPSTDNWTEWTFEQALKALTGEGEDLHAAAKATWFNFNPSPGASDHITYHAWGDYYYGVNVNDDAVTKWVQAVDAINEMMPDVARGKRGSMDLQTLRDLEGAIRDFGGWAQAVGGGMTQWANRLDSDDSSFRGKAAFLIYWRLKVNGDGLNDTYEQVNSRHGRPIADAVGDAADELANFNSTMSGHWNTAYILNIRDWINNSLGAEINAVAGYIDDSGLQLGLPNYKLNAFNSDVDAGKAFIRNVLQNYPKGDLTSASGWQKIGDSITQTTLDNLKNLLDTYAQTAISTLKPKYVLATTSLIEITPPPTETAPQPDPSNGDGGGGDGNLPPPPDGGGGANIPPPDGGGSGGGGGDIPPPDGSGGGGGDIPPPDGSGGADLPGAGGGGDGGLNVPGGGGDGLNVPGGDGPPADGGGNGAFVPSPVPPGGSDAEGGGTGKGVGPGGDGAFDENGGGDGVITPPDGGAGGSLLPPGAGKSDTAVPPGGGADGSGGFGSDPGKNFDPSGGLGDGLGAGAGAGGGLGGGFGGNGSGVGTGAGGGVGGGLGGGLGGAGGGLGGGLGGAGGVGGAGLGNNGLGGNGLLDGVPAKLTGGSPGLNGAPGSSGGSDGSGGVPFFPPMMGGAGAGGEKPQERERQTWLSEDEEIWGTRVAVGSGVIGRLDEEEFEAEEIPLAGPSRRARPDTRRRRRDEDERRKEEIQAPGEESGSASAT
ncbi:hypothetical protein [Actinoallomurus iriomotensis]|uniref:Uncharacterized protein n=1 Tax=Actinoallomurus iriomotensis TaxID=478107 RepID=A0A9W6VX71_9ACTN|nr:hypothetical protein [Actinoallomurus iriomotensis]GLY83555.1 hypothetical protein Airi02_014850 [Actinoallomurus iriomotensis]